jgi:hypothetical protein
LVKARDGVRRDTLNRVRLALEAYHDDHGVYPVCTNATTNNYCSSEPGDPWYASANYIPGLVPKYIDQLPRDPLGGPSPNCGGGAYRTFVYISPTPDNGQNYKFLSYCSSEVTDYLNGDPFHDPVRDWAWQVTNNVGVTSGW